MQNAYTRRINVPHGLWGARVRREVQGDPGGAGKLFLSFARLHPSQSGAGGPGATRGGLGDIRLECMRFEKCL